MLSKLLSLAFIIGGIAVLPNTAAISLSTELDETDDNQAAQCEVHR